MQEQLTARLKELRQDYDAGEKRLQVLEGEAVRLRETLLRISGAIQVLQELLEAPDPGAAANGVEGEAHNLPVVATA